ncbi:MAG: bifunctional UDP-N-acetylglucosamine diphosphorylase/glucosamine-1-phosphate N-acetyltransferase GlmU [Rhodospirillaceae bacterium]
MNESSIACVVLAAGKGTRMMSAQPKVLHGLAGRAMITHVLDTVATLEPNRVVVVVGPDMENVARVVAPLAVAIQSRRLGTGDAVRAASDFLTDFTGEVMVLYGDTPLVTPATLQRMIEARRAASDPAVVVLGFRPANPGAYGRLITNADGSLEKIVEHLDATTKERTVTLCNAGLMAFDGRRLFELLDHITCQNAKGEYYLTDAVGLARARNWTCAMVEVDDATEVLGINCRAELAEAEAIIQHRLRLRAMAGGATLSDPATTYFSMDTVLGRDVLVWQHVVFGPGVTIADRVEIKPFCHLERVTVAEAATIGPYARLRPGATIGPGAHIGNFVEIKNTDIAAGAKVNHLTYIGDASIGAKANIGAGTITCNYDGFAKHKTIIGAGAFIGSNTSLVAPVRIGDGAIVGAGSVVTMDVEADALTVARGRQQNLAGWAERFRAIRKKYGAGEQGSCAASSALSATATPPRD